MLTRHRLLPVLQTHTPVTHFRAVVAVRLAAVAVFREMMARPYVMGRDLIQAGLKPGEMFTQLLEHAHKLRLAGVDKETALRDVLAQARKLEKKKETP